ncbi:Uncharacterized protein APZ42_006269, partial [Daphnia magna]
MTPQNSSLPQKSSQFKIRVHIYLCNCIPKSMECEESVIEYKRSFDFSKKKSKTNDPVFEQLFEELVLKQIIKVKDNEYLMFNGHSLWTPIKLHYIISRICNQIQEIFQIDSSSTVMQKSIIDKWIDELWKTMLSEGDSADPKFRQSVQKNQLKSRDYKGLLSLKNPKHHLISI